MENKGKETVPELLKIATRLQKLRKEKGYKSYEHIAYELGMSRSAYWRLEAGENFSMKTLLKVCKVLEISLEEFFQGVDVPKTIKKKKK